MGIIMRNGIMYGVGGGGGGSGVTILHGSAQPSDAIGQDGQIYLKTVSPGLQSKEYIESSGHVSILTGVSYASDITWELKAAFRNNTYNNNVFGYGWSGKETNVLVAGSIYNQIGGTKISIPFDTNPHIYKATGSEIYIDDVHGSRGSDITAEVIRLFATAYGGRYDSGRISYARIYYCKIWKAGTLIRDFIPVTSSGLPAMFDLVNTELYTPSIGDNSSVFVGNSTDDIAVGTAFVEDSYCKVNGVWRALLNTDIDQINTGGS